MLPVLTPTDFIALANQTLEFAYPSVEIEGEVKNLRISRGKWLYFDIADDVSKIRCFGTVYIMPGPIEDGMKVRIIASPRMHPQFGFSLNLSSLQLSGEGTIKKAADLLREKLDKEGLFAEERKRVLPYPPSKIGLITSSESAAYKDFVKVLSARYGGIEVELANVQVQGDSAVGQVVRAVDWFNTQADTPEVLVIIRGGGSADDLQVFSTEQVTRAVAGSRIPTLVAIGHEVDVSLAELAADVRASTPSNAAEILVPDRKDLLASTQTRLSQLYLAADSMIQSFVSNQADVVNDLTDRALSLIADRSASLGQTIKTLEALNPAEVLKRGYAVARSGEGIVTSVKQVSAGDNLDIQLSDGHLTTRVQ